MEPISNIRLSGDRGESVGENKWWIATMAQINTDILPAFEHPLFYTALPTSLISPFLPTTGANTRLPYHSLYSLCRLTSRLVAIQRKIQRCVLLLCLFTRQASHLQVSSKSSWPISTVWPQAPRTTTLLYQELLSLPRERPSHQKGIPSLRLPPLRGTRRVPPKEFTLRLLRKEPIFVVKGRNGRKERDVDWDADFFGALWFSGSLGVLGRLPYKDLTWRSVLGNVARQKWNTLVSLELTEMMPRFLQLSPDNYKVDD